MAQCIKCGVQVGCGCKLTNGLCASCLQKEKETTTTQPPREINKEIEILVKLEDVHRLHNSRQEG